MKTSLLIALLIFVSIFTGCKKTEIIEPVKEKETYKTQFKTVNDTLLINIKGSISINPLNLNTKNFNINRSSLNDSNVLLGQTINGQLVSVNREVYMSSSLSLDEKVVSYKVYTQNNEDVHLTFYKLDGTTIEMKFEKMEQLRDWAY